MDVTKQMLEERLAMLRQEQEHLVSQVNACIGAISDCEHWLSVLNAPPQDDK